MTNFADPAVLGLMIPILGIFFLIGLPVVCITLVVLARIIRGDSRHSRASQNGSSREEAEIMQDIHRTMLKLEKRIDALETIVIDKPLK